MGDVEKSGARALAKETGAMDTEAILRQAGRGHSCSVDQLLTRHRGRLRQVVAKQLDARIAARVDPSDIVQEAFFEAAKKLPDYVARRPLPFFPWLRAIALQRVTDSYRRHVQAKRRSVIREENLPGRADRSSERLADRLARSGTSPSQHLHRYELRRRMRSAIGRLSHNDRQVMVLRYLEQMQIDEIAQKLGLTRSAVKMRHLRALERFRKLLDIEESDWVS